MARQLRVNLEGAFYHVFSRGNEQKPIFLDDQDRASFLEILGNTAEKYLFKYHAYALMSNHYHLLIETPKPNLSRGMHHTNVSYAEYFNRRHKRVGHLFQGRFKALLVEKESYLVILGRYIHQNPVAANLSFSPWTYAWSSCKEYLGLRKAPAWLHLQDTLSYFGEKLEEQFLAYKMFLESAAEEDPAKKAVGQTLLGSESFVESVRQALKLNPEQTNEIAHKTNFLARPSPEMTQEAIAKIFNIKPEELAGGTKQRMAKKLAIYLLKERAGLTLKEIADRFLLGQSGVSRIVSRLKTKMAQDENLRRQMTLFESAINEPATRTPPDDGA